LDETPEGRLSRYVAVVTGMLQIGTECNIIEDRYVPIALGYFMYLVYAGGLVSYRFCLSYNLRS
jgi:hypothetical protein